MLPLGEIQTLTLLEPVNVEEASQWWWAWGWGEWGASEVGGMPISGPNGKKKKKNSE